MRAWVELHASTKTGAQPVLVDIDDYLRLGGRGLSIGSHGYVQLAENGRMQLLHRWILGLETRDGLIGDHRDGNVTDYRRRNLRVVNASGSSQNVAGRGKSRYRGVHPMKSGRWQARVKFQGRNYFLGTYATEATAAAIADAKRRELMPFYVPPVERAR
ncbi:hypothetical protein [Micromonospora sp. WMMD737]|uniref:hypothetical protein n=1 Tax=Micromonospora sp. WMMD737 TaxID=3404113 RepID=UPI003B940419